MFHGDSDGQSEVGWVGERGLYSNRHWRWDWIHDFPLPSTPKEFAVFLLGSTEYAGCHKPYIWPAKCLRILRCMKATRRMPCWLIYFRCFGRMKYWCAIRDKHWDIIVGCGSQAGSTALKGQHVKPEDTLIIFSKSCVNDPLKGNDWPEKEWDYVKKCAG